jgi:WD40 repeat protein
MGKECSSLKNGRSTAPIAFFPDGRWLAASGGNEVFVWESASLSKYAAIQTQAESSSYVVFSEDSQTIFTSGFLKVVNVCRIPKKQLQPSVTEDGVIALWDASTM